MKAKNIKLLIMLILLPGLLTLAVAILWHVIQPREPVVHTATVQQGNIATQVMATGILKPVQQVSVGAQVSGQLKKLYVKQGSRVHRGQLLAEIDPTLQCNELRKSEASLQSALAQKQLNQAMLRQYSKELARQMRLDREDSGVKSELEKVQAQFQMQTSQLKVNEAQIVQAKMGLKTARANLGFTRILAPIDGQVLGIVTQEGQTIVSSQAVPTILVLANVDSMTVHTRISETDILNVQVGQPLWFYVASDPERRYDSVMGAIQGAPDDALEDERTPTSSVNSQPSAIYYNGVFTVGNPDNLLRTAMTAQVFITTAQAKHVLLIPVTALGKQHKRNCYEVRLMSGQQLLTRWIEVGINDGQFAEVKKGLKEGDKVVLVQHIAGEINHD